MNRPFALRQNKPNQTQFQIPHHGCLALPGPSLLDYSCKDFQKIKEVVVKEQLNQQ